MPPRKRKMNNEDEDTDDEKKKMKQTTLPFGSKRIATLNAKAEEKKLKFDLEWSEHGEPSSPSKDIRPLIYLWSKTLPGKAKIAAFDIDNTIIVTKSGKKFATNAQDWTWFDKSVPAKLKELDADDYRIVFITNQAGVEKGHTKPSELKTKFESMIRELEIPVFIFIATGENHYRKPSVQMWKFLETNCNQSVSVDMKESFYVGDAAGRPKNWAPGKPKDFSCADRMFASNNNLKFYTPEELFLKQKPAPFEWGSIDPNKLLEEHTTSPTAASSSSLKNYHSTEQELILMIGPPASGKSTFTKSHFVKHGYVSVNRDTLSTQEKCLKATQAALAEGKSVVVDNTNPSRRVRAEYISLAKKNGVKKIRCFRMTTPIELCHHLNYVRQNQTAGQVRRVPDVGYNMFKNQLEEPTLDEGFDEIVSVDFSPRFETKQHEEIFKQWTA